MTIKDKPCYLRKSLSIEEGSIGATAVYNTILVQYLIIRKLGMCLHTKNKFNIPSRQMFKSFLGNIIKKLKQIEVKL